MPGMRRRRHPLVALLVCSLALASVAVLPPRAAAADSSDAMATAVAGGSAQPSDVGQTDSAGEGWSWPLSPRPDVVAAFDPPVTPYGPGHFGVDLLGWPGQPVTAVADGTVSFAGQVAGTPVVVVAHGRERSTYQPVVAMVHRGDPVVVGALVGTLSNVSGHCLPLSCLHLGRRAGDVYLDPLELLGGGPVRLLPRADSAGGREIPGSPLLPRALTSPPPEWVRSRAAAHPELEAPAGSPPSIRSTALLAGAATGLAVGLGLVGKDGASNLLT